MKERPILFSGEMVRAILAGRKTQTRRVIKPQPAMHDFGIRGAVNLQPAFVGTLHKTTCNAVGVKAFNDGAAGLVDAPFRKSQRLWVRETFFDHNTKGEQDLSQVEYRATEWERDYGQAEGTWRPLIFMPRWASRLTLEVTNVCVERLQNVSGFDARAEGYPHEMSDADLMHYGGGKLCRQWFQKGWDELNAKRGFGWDANPFVWVVSFRRISNDL